MSVCIFRYCITPQTGFGDGAEWTLTSTDGRQKLLFTDFTLLVYLFTTPFYQSLLLRISCYSMSSAKLPCIPIYTCSDMF